MSFWLAVGAGLLERRPRGGATRRHEDALGMSRPAVVGLAGDAGEDVHHPVAVPHRPHPAPRYAPTTAAEQHEELRGFTIYQLLVFCFFFCIECPVELVRKMSVIIFLYISKISFRPPNNGWFVNNVSVTV